MRSIVVAALLAAGTAHAQFKCTTPAGVTLQQLPCAAEARSEALRIPVMTPERPDRIMRAIAVGEITLGMTRAEVERAARRAPDRVNSSVHAGRIDHQLVYRLKNPSRVVYVYLENGIVTSHAGDE